ncbi:hypothetical protein AX16_008685 [Volvariella volvacea WC 439]|nr:hypothetical protein AX16_008685 [Volvariella volvacea WC 439]
MPKSRQRKKPITQIDPHSLDATKSSSKPKSSRSVIRRFHTLLKTQARLKKDADKNKVALEETDRSIEELGGLGFYQRMSAIGQGNDRGGGSEKFFIGWLKELGSAKCKDSGEKKRYVAADLVWMTGFKFCIQTTRSRCS